MHYFKHNGINNRNIKSENYAQNAQKDIPNKNALVHISVFVVVLLVTFGVAGCKKKEPPKPTEVTVVEIIEDEIHEIWTLVGQTVSDPKVELLARVKGFLVKRNFKQGAFVKKVNCCSRLKKINIRLQ